MTMPPTTPAPHRLDRRYALAFGLCAVASLVPIWSARWLPMVDLPQHLALVSIWRHLDDPAWGFAGKYELHYGMPYLLGSFLLRGLTAFLDPIAAAHVAVSLFVVGLPLSTDLLLRSAGADRWWSLAAFPAAYGFCFAWGFLPYYLAVPLALAFLAAAFRYARRATVAAGVGLAAFGVALYPTHAVALGIALCAAAIVIAAQAPTWRSVAVRLLPLAAPVPLLLAWSASTRQTEATAALPSEWVLGPRRLGELPGMLFGTSPDVVRDVPLSVDVLAVAILVALAALVAVARPRPRAGLAYTGPVALVAGVFLVAPASAFGSSFLYERVTAFLVPLAALVLGAPSSERGARVARLGLVAIVVASMAVWTVRYRNFDAEAKGFDEALETIPPGQRVIGLPFRSMSAAIPGAPFYVHYAAWVQAMRGGTIAYSFAKEYAQLVRYRPGVKPPMTPGVNFIPQSFRWEVDGAYDYFLVRAFEDAGPFLFRRATEPVELVTHAGAWWVYRRASAAPPVLTR